MILKYIAIIFAVAWAMPARATVNTEKVRGGHDQEGFGGHIDGSVNLTSGNTETLTLGGSLRFQYESLYASESDLGDLQLRRTKDLKFLIGNVQKAEGKQGVFVDNGFAHLRWTRMWLPWVGTEAFTQYQFNYFQRLQLRQLGGGGGRLVLFHRNDLQAFWGSGYFYEIEKINVPSGAPDSAVRRSGRWNNYLSLHANIGRDSAALINTIYIQPRLDAFGDYRLLDESELRVAIRRHLSLVVTCAYAYQSRPPTDVRPQDLTLMNSLRFDF